MNDVDLIVIGGGPAGTTAASKATRLGLRVLLLEAGAHPRAHVGESLLPGIIPILADLGVLAAIEAAGFGRKTGSTLWHWGRTPRWDLWFADSDAYDAAWLVERARFDQILFEHARALGVECIEHASAREVVWDGDRAIGVRWSTRDGTSTTTHAPFVVDASGQSALIGRHRGSREPIAGLRHQAMWAHFDHAARLPAPRDAQALFIATAQQWWWMFPISAQRTSVGVVQLDAELRQGPPRPDFDAELAACEELVAVLGPDAVRATPVRHERDWSYRQRDVAGPGWMLVGDAAGFIDPVLSTGVMLAMHSGWHAALSAAASLGGDPQALPRYRDHYRSMFDDLLRMVRFYYQQNLERDDYFWESKRILMDETNALRPQKAFVILTSGLVQNLALDELSARRQRRVDDTTTELAADPDRLGFVCLHLRRGPGCTDGNDTADGPDTGTSVFVLIEPADPAAPTLFTTRNFHVNAIAPRHGNDPIAVPELAGPIRALGASIAALDVTPGESLAGFWRRNRAAIVESFARAPGGFTLVRAFGE